MGHFNDTKYCDECGIHTNDIYHLKDKWYCNTHTKKDGLLMPKTQTGKLMTSERVEREFSTPPVIQGITYTGPSTDIMPTEKLVQWCRGKISRLEGVVGNLTRQYAQLLSIWIALHPSEASQALKAHPDNLANYLEPDHAPK